MLGRDRTGRLTAPRQQRWTKVSARFCCTRACCRSGCKAVCAEGNRRNAMPNNLLTPIVNDRTRSVNFFNGRLLTGEDLTAEQQANRVAHSLLGQSIGPGVAYGLEVSESTVSSTKKAPVLAVTRGLAINPNGAL